MMQWGLFVLLAISSLQVSRCQTTTRYVLSTQKDKDEFVVHDGGNDVVAERSWNPEHVKTATLDLIENEFPLIWHNFSSIVELDVGVYGAVLKEDVSRTSYLAVSSSISCGDIVLTGNHPMSCITGDGNTTIEFSQLKIPAKNDECCVELTISVTEEYIDNALDLQDVFTMAIHRMYIFTKSRETYTWIQDNHTSREDTARIVVGFGYFFLYTAFVCWMLMGGIWQSWYCACNTGMFEDCCSPFNEMNSVMYMWMIIYLLIGNVICWAGGFAVYAGASVALGLAMLVMLCVYRGYCIRCCKQDESDDDVELAPVATTKLQFDHQSSATSSGEELHKFGIRKTWLCALFGVACGMIVLLIIAIGAWHSKTYYVYSRTTQKEVSEYQPAYITKSVFFIYAFDGFAQAFRFDTIMQIQTDWCGANYNSPLTTDSEKKQKIKVGFIDEYNINMKLYDPSDYRDYDTVNHWFSRKIIMDNRPIYKLDDTSVAVSPADSRFLAFEDVPTGADFWIKSEEFSIRKLLINYEDYAKFDRGVMMIARLAPQDYHRFHSPVTGFVTYYQEYDGGTLFSVNADAMSSGNLAILNQRTAAVIDTVDFGPVGFVAIGATCVGSVKFTEELVKGVNDDGSYEVQKGDNIGWFEFGGSTVVLVFQRGIEIDEDILYRSSMAVETLLRVGMSIGRK